ncbi:unnamed protein product [Symbiodinium sp. CCMP2592]|nr:unnamed protein product [Symbiodinium sp. CCMP2592]
MMPAMAKQCKSLQHAICSRWELCPESTAGFLQAQETLCRSIPGATKVEGGVCWAQTLSKWTAPTDLAKLRIRLSSPRQFTGKCFREDTLPLAKHSQLKSMHKKSAVTHIHVLLGQAAVPATGTRLRRGDLARRKAACIEVPETSGRRNQDPGSCREHEKGSCLRVLMVWRFVAARHRKRLEISC